DSRRTASARVRDFRAHGFALSSKAKRLSGGGQGEALAGLSQQPPRGRRRILHFNVTEHPTSDWIGQQLREALPLPCPYRYVLFDHDAKFGGDVVELLQASAIKPIRTSVWSPWQNGVAERWGGSIRREVPDLVIPLNDQHLRRLGREYIAYSTQTEHTSACTRRHRRAGRLSHARPNRPDLRPFVASAAFIIGTLGRNLRDRSRPRSDH